MQMQCIEDCACQEGGQVSLSSPPHQTPHKSSPSPNLKAASMRRAPARAMKRPKQPGRCHNIGRECSQPKARCRHVDGRRGGRMRVEAGQ